MGDDIDNAKENMRSILSTLSEKSSDYRVAVVDYRDFSDRTGKSQDYPAKVQLSFTDDDDAIYNAINALSLGNGGDNPETVYSAIMTTLALDWRFFLIELGIRRCPAADRRQRIYRAGDDEPA